MLVNGGAARRDMWAGHIERCLAGRYDRQRAVRVQQGGGVQPMQRDGLLL